MIARSIERKTIIFYARNFYISFYSNHFFLRLSVDILETFPHEMWLGSNRKRGMPIGAQ